MAEKKRSVADAVALVVLCVITAAVSVLLAAHTDIEVVPRFASSVAAGVVAAGLAYAITTRMTRER